jgi:hypothetical protein
MNNYRIVPVQHLCVLCGSELLARDTSQGIAGRLCRACIGLLVDQVHKELDRRTKTVRVQ